MLLASDTCPSTARNEDPQQGQEPRNRCRCSKTATTTLRVSDGTGVGVASLLRLVGFRVLGGDRPAARW